MNPVETELATDALYVYVPIAKIGESVPDEIVKFERLAVEESAVHFAYRTVLATKV